MKPAICEKPSMITQSHIPLDRNRIESDQRLVQLLIGLSTASFIAFLANNLALRLFLRELARLFDKFLS